MDEVSALGVEVLRCPAPRTGWAGGPGSVRTLPGGPVCSHRSHEVVPIDACRITHPAVRDAPLLEDLG
jgi:hypothetical protein